MWLLQVLKSEDSHSASCYVHITSGVKRARGGKKLKKGWGRLGNTRSLHKMGVRNPLTTMSRLDVLRN